MSIAIDISIGEFIDRLTILEIKTERIADPLKLENIQRELETVRAAWRGGGYDERAIAEETAALKALNEHLWEIEDRIRAKERQGAFDEEFIGLARAVYRSNDRRAALKRRISEKLSSRILEEKYYAPY